MKKQATIPMPSLEKKLPELHAWFEFLNGGYEAGAKWQSLLEGYVHRIGRRRARRLALELDQLLYPIDLALLGDNGAVIATCDLLGLNPGVPASEHLAPDQFLHEMRDALANLV